MARLKIAVTGSDGFIGTNLAETLKDSDIEIVPFSGDLLKKEDIELFFQKNHGIDQIIHLVGLFFGSLDELIKLNVLAFNNLLEAATKNGVKKVIFTSTGAVYGEPIGERSKESDPLRPNTCYGLSKKYAEECLLYYADNFNLDYVILRFPNVYGPNNNKGVVFTLLKSIEEHGKVTIFGDGTQSRNFLHVSDACIAIKQSIDFGGREIFNISNPNKVSVNDVVELLAKKHKFKIEHEPANNNLKDLLLDIEKANQKLGFEPQMKELLV